MKKINRFEIMDLGQYKYFQQKYKDIEKKGICEYKKYINCKKNKTSWIKAVTRYPYYRFDILKWKEDPNRDLFLCKECSEEYYSYWNDMWNEYYSMVM